MINELRPFTAVFNPAGAAHSTLIGPCGASISPLSCVQQTCGIWTFGCPRASRSIAAPETCLARPSPVLRFKTPTADSVVVGAHVLEMLGAIAGLNPQNRLRRAGLAA
jgi:hypothetical protein